MNKKYFYFFYILLSPFIGLTLTKLLDVFYWICFENRMIEESRNLTIALLSVMSFLVIMAIVVNKIENEK